MSIIGISIEIGNGDRKCTRIDAEGRPAEISSDFFEKHPTYADIKPAIIDGQHMVRIPAFYARQDRSGEDGKTVYRYWISPGPAEGFHLHSAFMYIGMPTDAFWVGAYEGSIGADGEICSLPGVMPAGNNDFFDMRAACAARNRDDAMGWRMQNIRMLAAVQRLMIIEAGTTDSQAAYGLGNVQRDGLKKTGESGLCWRGIYDLWGNSITMIDGIIFDEQHVIHIEDSKGLGEYINTGAHAASNSGWPTDIAFADGKFFSLSDCFIPSGADDEGEPSESFAPDNTWRSWPDEKNVFYSGGRWGFGSAAGLFYSNFLSVASGSDADLGCRLAKVQPEPWPLFPERLRESGAAVFYEENATMATTTRIEWADATTNTAVGCSHCSPGCDHCYAERFAHRLSKHPVAKKIYAGVVDERGKWTGKINSNFSEKMYPHRVPGKGKRVFVGSMTDIFHPNYPAENRDELFASIMADYIFANGHGHTFIILTKRPHAMAEYFAAGPETLLRRWGKAGNGWIIVGDGDSEMEGRTCAVAIAEAARRAVAGEGEPS